jgi:DNA-directed RNA polymerase specialized sigma subunit
MENTKLIRKIAWSFATRTGVDFRELLAEANLAYLEALQTYDPSKSKVSTHVWNCVNGSLKNYIAQEVKHLAMDIDEVELPVNAPSYFEKLSKEAQEIAEIVLSAPEDFIAMAQPEAKDKIKNILQNQGWDLKKIFRNMKELSVIYS